MTAEIRLTRGFVALVDDEDYAAVIAAGSWCARPSHQTVYAHRYSRRSHGPKSTISLHTFLTGWPLVDHRNGDGLDNRRANLRPATVAQNNANVRLRRDNLSGFKGVSRMGRRWYARIGANGAIRLGGFDSPEAAARAYDAAARDLFGEFARLNFPEETAA